MDEPAIVRRLEGLANLPRDGQRLGKRYRPGSNPLGQGDSLDQFHHQRLPAARSLDAVEGGDVGMIQRRKDARRALETLEVLGVEGMALGQHLDRDVAPEPRIAGAVDLSHPSAPEKRRHIVRADPAERWLRAGGAGGVGKCGRSLLAGGTADEMAGVLVRRKKALDLVMQIVIAVAGPPQEGRALVGRKFER